MTRVTLPFLRRQISHARRTSLFFGTGGLIPSSEEDNIESGLGDGQQSRSGTQQVRPDRDVKFSEAEHVRRASTALRFPWLTDVNIAMSIRFTFRIITKAKPESLQELPRLERVRNRIRG